MKRPPTTLPLLAGLVFIAVIALGGLSALFGGAKPLGTSVPSASLPTSAQVPTGTPSSPPSTIAPGPTVSAAGTFAPAGFWVVSDRTLLISADGGATWSAGTLPSSASVSVPSSTLLDVLDASHVWALTADAFGTGVSGDIAHDKLALTIHRSTDGGRTWADIPIGGNYPGSLQALAFLDADHGYLLISPGRFDAVTSTLLRTTDGGLTWGVAGTDGWLGTELATPNASTIWAGSAGDAGPVERRIFTVSRDGGQTWRDVPLPGVAHATGQFASFLQPPIFIGGTTGIALVAHNDGSGIADIDRSDDGGENWTRVATTTARSLAVLSQTSWLRAGPTPGTIEGTKDAGLTWQPLAASGLPAAPISWIGFADASHGALTAATGVASSSGLYVTSDGGSTWRPADLTATSVTPATPEPTAAPIATVSSVAFFDATHGLVVGSTPGGKGAVWRTADGGRTWSEKTLNTIQLTSVTVAGSSFAWTSPRCVIEPISATGCSLLASVDGGQSWRVVSDGEFNALSFVDAQHGWGVTPAFRPPPGAAVDRVLSTTDGGRTWTALPAAPCATIGWSVSISFVSRIHGWVGCTGEGGAGMAAKGVAETTDGGRTWVLRARVTPPGDPPAVGAISMADYLDGISMRPSGLGLAWEGRGGTMRTADGGGTWTPMPPGGSDAGPIPAGGWAVTDRDWLILLWDPNVQATVLYATHDGGGTWQAVSQVGTWP